MIIDLKKRYWVFSIESHYPCGGLGDVSYTSDSLMRAEDAGRVNPQCYGDDISIFDSVDRVFVVDQLTRS
jgi:hypothetical protein